MTDTNTGECNSGHYNSGHYNSGHYNTGDRNTGDRNTGHYNTGYRNSGHYNTGACNTGNYNTGDWHTGSFNTTVCEGGYFFNKWLTHKEWGSAYKPQWLYAPRPTTWVEEGDMSVQEKKDNPDFSTQGGYLKVNDMAQEWRKAFEGASEEDIQAVRDLPNFDYDVFEEITGLDLRHDTTTTCEGKIVEIDGKKYRLEELK